jgi:hypothetical protein
MSRNFALFLRRLMRKTWKHSPAAQDIPLATFLLMEMSIRACNFLFPPAMCGARDLLIFGVIPTPSKKYVLSACATSRPVLVVRMSQAARGVLGLRTWKAICAAPQFKTARNHSQEPESLQPTCCRRPPQCRDSCRFKRYRRVAQFLRTDSGLKNGRKHSCALLVRKLEGS